MTQEQPQETPQMGITEALTNLTQVCSRAQGDLAFHTVVQSSLAVVGSTITKLSRRMMEQDQEILALREQLRKEQLSGSEEE